MNLTFNYTTINHIARKDMKLSMHEYALCDLVYHLSSSPKSLYPGWCYASKDTLGELLDLTKQTVHSLIKKLLDRGLLEKSIETKHLKVTFDWYSRVIIKDSKETLPPVKNLYSDSKETLPLDSKETLHNKDIYNKDKKVNVEKILSLSEEEVKKLPDVLRVYRLYLLCFGKTPNQLKLTDGRKNKIEVRLKSYPLEDIAKAIKNASKDDFYSGRKTGWKATLEWIMNKDENIERLRDLTPRSASQPKPDKKILMKFEDGSEAWVTDESGE